MATTFPRGLRLPFHALLLGISVVGFALLPARGNDDAARVAKLNGGYFLLHQLSDDEAQVPLLMMVKHAPEEIKTFADRISKVAKKSLESLDRMQDRDAAIRFDQNPLPAIERDSRASIKGDKQHQLLFGTSDAEFVRNFLVSQIEASTYAAHLGKVLAEQESDPPRAQTLHHLSVQWLNVRDQAFRLLRNY